MAFRIHRFAEHDLTIVKAGGNLDCEEVATIIRNFYGETGQKPTTLALWDLRNASLEYIHDWEAAWISQVAEHTQRDRKNGKSAFVVSSDLDYGISRMISSWCCHLPLALATFRSVEEAVQWLQGGETNICELVDRVRCD